jgi:S-adenosylmethionine:tRNA ribosyltransferase-isomerase
MRVADFDYHLPAELIAQHPPEERDGGRLLVLDRGSGGLTHREVRDLPDLLEPGTLMVLNDSRVIPARLWARRPSGGRVELLLLERLAEEGGLVRWRAMLRSSKTPAAGEQLTLDVGGGEQVTVVDRPHHGRCELLLPPRAPWRHGAMPLPPYIRRANVVSDRERYQTVYAEEEGSVAAPTAGLHFTDELLGKIGAAGVELCRVTLHVGPGTFQPVRVEEVDEHRMEGERYSVPAETARAIARAQGEGRPVLAVGTTVVRTLESTGGAPGEGRTELFIRPGHRFRVVDRMLTNFHLPRSTLLMLVSALAGRERVLEAYAEAVQQRYRFYSYGDAMLIL